MSKTRKIAISVLAVAFALCLAFATSIFSLNVNAEAAPEAQTNFDMWLNVSDHSAALIDNVLELETEAELADGSKKKSGLFVVKGGYGKAMEIDGNEKSPQDLGLTFTSRLKFGGKTEENLDRTISFDLEGPAEVVVYAYSASSSDSTRKIQLYKNAVAPVLIGEEVTTSTGSSIPAIRFNTTSAGNYYFACDNNGVNVYFIGVNYEGAAAPVSRSDWSGVTAPAITAATATTATNTQDGKLRAIRVNYTGVVGENGADYIDIQMFKSSDTTFSNVIATQRVIKYSTAGSVTFVPSETAEYTFRAVAVRRSETASISNGATQNHSFALVLEEPSLRGQTGENGAYEVTITEVKEASHYILSYKAAADALFTDLPTINHTGTGEATYTFASGVLTVGGQYTLRVVAVRNTPSAQTDPVTINITVRSQQERDWQFAYFGQSTKESLNYMRAADGVSEGGNIYDGLYLNSCTYQTDGKIASKGGKYTYGAMDGISYYYTKIDAKAEDFTLRTKVTVNYLNPQPDGQDGFALLIRDSIGENKSTNYFYTNSAAAIATKLEYSLSKPDLRNGIGVRFVTGVERTDAAPAVGTIVQKMYAFEQNTVATGSVYYLEVAKINNTYAIRYLDRSGNIEKEYTLFHTETTDDGNPANDHEYDPLLQVDKDNVYVGFSVARGCNATFTDISFEATERSTDYVEIVPAPVEGEYAIASPTSTSIPQYNFRFSTTASGVLNVYLNQNPTSEGATPIIANKRVDVNVANKEVIAYYNEIITLSEQNNTIYAVFDPDDDFKTKDGESLDFDIPVTVDRIVGYNYFGKKAESIVVAPMEITAGIPLGSPTNNGSMEAPLDLQTAIDYVLPGQTILMLGGTYRVSFITVQKGNNGTADAIKTLRSHPDNTTRPVLDFTLSGDGFTMWGDYWHLYGFDITKTKEGKKGMQLGGHYNVVENVDAYYNGGTGIQVSGKSVDPKELWPSHNLVLNCTSYGNKDAQGEDADGFAAKLYCGEGNVFRGCVAYCNVDDGWDLYAKTENGSIGAVTIDSCITFGNGMTTTQQADGTFLYDGGVGNGNGFKLGGESLPAKHVLTNSIAFANKAKGVDSNSAPDIKVYNTLSLYNRGANFAFYTTAQATDYYAENVISLLGTTGDDISSGKQTTSMFTASTYFYDGSRTANSASSVIQPSILNGFTNPSDYFGFTLDTTTGGLASGSFDKVIKAIKRNADGSLDLSGLFELNSAPVTVGITATPGSVSGNLEFLGVNYADGFNDKILYIGDAGKLPIGAIIGIAVGGVVILLAAAYLCGYFFLYKKGKLEGTKLANIYKWLKK